MVVGKRILLTIYSQLIHTKKFARSSHNSLNAMPFKLRVCAPNHFLKTIEISYAIELGFWGS
jgi:hypothetical protein